MDVIYTDKEKRGNPRTVVTGITKYRVRVGRSLQHAYLEAMQNEGSWIVLINSLYVQNDYLFLQQQICKRIMEECLQKILEKSRTSNDVIDVDAILEEVLSQNQEALLEAEPVNLAFTQNPNYATQLIKAGAWILRMKQAVRREEVRLFKEAVQSYGHYLEPDEAIKHASTYVGLHRHMNKLTCNTVSVDFHQWLLDFFAENDRIALVRYCARPSVCMNNHLENMVFMILYNVPTPEREVYTPFPSLKNKIIGPS